MMQHQLFAPVTDETVHSSPNSSVTTAAKWDNQALYRLQCYAEPLVLNSYRIWTQALEPWITLTAAPKATAESSSWTPAFELLSQLSHLMSRILMGVTSDEDGLIDYVAARAHPLYPVFEEAVCALQVVSLQDMDDRSKAVRHAGNTSNRQF